MDCHKYYKEDVVNNSFEDLLLTQMYEIVVKHTDKKKVECHYNTISQAVICIAKNE